MATFTAARATLEMVIATDVGLSGAVCITGGRFCMALFLPTRVTSVVEHLHVSAFLRIFMWDELELCWNETQTDGTSGVFPQLVLTVNMTGTMT